MSIHIKDCVLSSTSHRVKRMKKVIFNLHNAKTEIYHILHEVDSPFIVHASRAKNSVRLILPCMHTTRVSFEAESCQKSYSAADIIKNCVVVRR